MTAFPRAQRRARKTAAKKAKMPALIIPHHCVVLAVDPGESSGWAVLLRGVVMSSGEVAASSIRDIESIIAWAWRCAHDRQMAVVLVRERPFGGRMGTNSSGASRVWKACWDSAPYVVKSRSVTVYPSTWRAKVLGRGWGSKPRDVVRPEEQRVAKMIRQNSEENVGPDEAAAICIGAWASRSGEVATKLPPKAKR